MVESHVLAHEVVVKQSVVELDVLQVLDDVV